MQEGEEQRQAETWSGPEMGYEAENATLPSSLALRVLEEASS